MSQPSRFPSLVDAAFAASLVILQQRWHYAALARRFRAGLLLALLLLLPALPASAAMQKVDAQTAQQQLGWLWFPPPRFLPTLAEMSAAEGQWLVNGLAVIGLLVGIGVGLQKLLGRKGPHPMSIEGQPIIGEISHPCVPKPDHEKQMGEVWQNVNGLRRAIAAIETSVARVATAREDNGRRLDTIEQEVSSLAKSCAALEASLEALNQTIHALDAKLDRLRDGKRH